MSRKERSKTSVLAVQNNMKYGRIAGNSHINAHIYHCFEPIYEQDQRRFLEKFRHQSSDSDQTMHTYRELILGAYLSANGLSVRYDYRLQNNTPDWCILDDTFAVVGIIELVNFHIDKLTEREIKKQIEAQGIALYHPNNFTRLYYCISHKAQKYQTLVKNLQIPYVVAVFGLFEPAVDFKEVQRCIFDEHIGVFKIYPDVSGVLYFQENLGRYLFNYAVNSNRLEVIELPSSVFPSGV